jgi:hypothetical protein
MKRAEHVCFEGRLQSYVCQEHTDGGIRRQSLENTGLYRSRIRYEGGGELFYKLRLDPRERELTDIVRVEENERPFP